MDEIVDKSSHFKRMCQLLLSLKVIIIHYIYACVSHGLRKKARFKDVNNFNELQQI